MLEDTERSTLYIMTFFFFFTFNKQMLEFTLDYTFLCVEILIFLCKILCKSGRGLWENYSILFISDENNKNNCLDGFSLSLVFSR